MSANPMSFEDERELRDEASLARLTATSLVINTPTAYDDAATFALTLARTRKKIVAFFEPMKRAAKAAHEAVCQSEHAALDPVVEAEAHVSGLIVSYRREQTRLRLAAEATERERLRKIAEDAQISAAIADPVHEKQILAQAITVPSPVFADPVVPEHKGLSFRSARKARVVNKEELVRFVAKYPSFDNLLVVNQTALDAMAKAQGSSFNIPGCESYTEETTSKR